MREREIGVAEDAGEQVVEVVRHAAGEHAQALQLLHLHHPRFEPVAFVFGALAAGHVAGDFDDRGEAILRVGDAANARVDPDARAVLAEILPFADEFAAVADALEDVGDGAAGGFGKALFEAASEHLVGGPAEEGDGGIVPVVDAPFRVGDDNRLGDAGEQQTAVRELAFQVAEALGLALEIVEESGVARARIAHWGDGTAHRHGEGTGTGRDTRFLDGVL